MNASPKRAFLLLVSGVFALSLILAPSARAQAAQGVERHAALECLWGHLTPQDRGRTIGLPMTERLRDGVRYHVPIHPERLLATFSPPMFEGCGLAFERQNIVLSMLALSYWTSEEFSLAMMEREGARRADFYANVNDLSPERMAMLRAAFASASRHRLTYRESGLLGASAAGRSVANTRQENFAALALVAHLRFRALEDCLDARDAERAACYASLAPQPPEETR